MTNWHSTCSSSGANLCARCAGLGFGCLLHGSSRTAAATGNEESLNRTPHAVPRCHQGIHKRA